MALQKKVPPCLPPFCPSLYSTPNINGSDMHTVLRFFHCGDPHWPADMCVHMHTCNIYNVTTIDDYYHSKWRQQH